MNFPSKIVLNALTGSLINSPVSFGFNNCNSLREKAVEHSFGTRCTTF